MRCLVGLLLTCSLAGAIPLRKGETWTWLVVDRQTNARQWRTAMVLDSVKLEADVVWRIQARDSLTKTMDTGSILARPDGSQSWRTLSKFLPWEPLPLSPEALGRTILNVDTSGPLPWGMASLGRSQQLAWTVQMESDILLCGYDVFYNVQWANCPEHRWSDSVGVLRARFHGRSQEDWILQAHNGKAFSVEPVKLALPEVGATLVWQETSRLDSLFYGGGRIQRKEGPYTRTWAILERPADSGDWVRIRIRETLRSDSSSRDSAFDLRMNTLTGERIPVRGNAHPTPDEAWRQDWTEPEVVIKGIRYRRLRTYEGGKSYRPSVFDDDTRSWMKIGPEDQMDSLAEIRYRRKGEGGAYPWDSTIYTRVLLSIDGKVVRSGGQTGVAPAVGRTAFGLAGLARRHPALPVRWCDMRGQSGQILAKQLEMEGVPAGNGVLLLSATLPDGRPWSGSLFRGSRFGVRESQGDSR